MSKKEEQELLNMRKNINTLLNKNISFKKTSSIQIDKVNISTDMLIITTIFALVWIFIWFMLGFFDIGHYTIVFFFLYIGVELFNIVESSLTVEVNNIFSTSKYNDNISKGETFFSIIIILYIFVFTMGLDKDSEKIIYKLLTVMLFFSAILLFKIKFKDNSRNMRNLMIIDQKINNQIIVLFIMCIYLIFIYHKKI